MIKATSKKQNYITEINDEPYILMADGRDGIYQRPTNILASAYAACMNITVRKALDKRMLAYDTVNVEVELDLSDLDHTLFYSKIDIIGDIDEQIKKEIIESANDCSVCKVLRSTKQFLPLD